MTLLDLAGYIDRESINQLGTQLLCKATRQNIATDGYVFISGIIIVHTESKYLHMAATDDSRTDL